MKYVVFDAFHLGVSHFILAMDAFRLDKLILLAASLDMFFCKIM